MHSSSSCWQFSILIQHIWKFQWQWRQIYDPENFEILFLGGFFNNNQKKNGLGS